MRRVLLLLAAATGLGATCGTYSWHNFSKTQQVEPEYMAAPRSVDELVRGVQLAIENGKRIRMTGSGHSHSNVAITNEVLLTSRGLKSPLTLDRARLKDPNAFGLVRVQSGITLRELNAFRADHRRRRDDRHPRLGARLRADRLADRQPADRG
jgi:FAD/FMN-containing dehydrogenase